MDVEGKKNNGRQIEINNIDMTKQYDKRTTKQLAANIVAYVEVALTIDK